jgi:hypothetical protein
MHVELIAETGGFGNGSFALHCEQLEDRGGIVSRDGREAGSLLA